MSSLKMCEARSTKLLMKHPVFEQEFDFSGKYGLDLTDDRVHDLKKIFSIANLNQTGVIGRKQFTDLMDLLRISPTEAELDKMMMEMDENGDGEIEFEEFAVAMVHTYDDDMLTAAASTAIGSRGTRMWERGEIVWSLNSNVIIWVLSMFTMFLLYFDFILVPLFLAYFMVFLLLPLQLAFYKCKIPAALAAFAAMGLLGGVLIFLVSLVGGELAAFMDDPEIQDNMLQLQIDFDVALNESGMVILAPPTCEYIDECPFGSKNCYGPKGIGCAHDGYTPEQLSGYIAIFSGFFNQFALVLLFLIYVMTEINPEVPLLGHMGAAAAEIEDMVSHYINLKTMLSFATGCAVSVILLLIGVKLAVLFGIMSFVLNYIPNVGSVIAMCLPTPVVLLDSNLESWQQVMAFLGPGTVQMYVGNVLEPTVFGASLNLTPMSILLALVMWGSIWGLSGAVLSVPLLGIQKILMVYTNHPFAKYCLILVREDPTLDEAKERHHDPPGTNSFNTKEAESDEKDVETAGE